MTKRTKTPSLIGGKTLDEWDLQWRTVKGGFHSHRQYRHKTGLFRVSEKGVITAIGKSAGIRDRLGKRMYDLIRPGDSGRRHRIGRYINANLDTLDLEVLIVGESWTDADTVNELKRAMIERHQPRENVSADIIKRIAFG